MNKVESSKGLRVSVTSFTYLGKLYAPKYQEECYKREIDSGNRVGGEIEKIT